MGASGAIVMSFFGALFASLTLLLQWQWRGALLALPFLAFAAIGAAAVATIRLPGAGFVRPPRAGDAMMWSSIGEGVGLFVVNQIAIGLGRPDLVIPAMALVVGLHFVPIAYWSPFPPLYRLAGVMIAGGGLGLVLGGRAGATLAGFTAAAALTAAALAALRRERAAKRGVRNGGTIAA